MLELRSDEWIINTLQAADLPTDEDYYHWKQAHKEIMIDLFFVSHSKDIQHEIMCEIDGLMMGLDISPISEPTKRGAKTAELLIDYLSDFVLDMMQDYDSQQLEREA